MAKSSVSIKVKPRAKSVIRTEVTLGSNGRLVLPAEVRESLGLKEGDKLTLLATERGIELATRRMALKALQQLMAKHKKPGESIVDEFIREKRAEAARE